MSATSATWRIEQGDCLARLRDLPDVSVQTCITSPPYFALRDYGTGEWEGGDAGCDHVKREMRRGLGLADSPAAVRGGGHKVATTADLTFGDVCGKCGAQRIDEQIGLEDTPELYVERLVAVFREVRRVLRDDGTLWLNLGDSYNAYNANRGGARGLNELADQARNEVGRGLVVPSLKQKDLLGIPWMVAFALRADGWYLRADIIWHKPNPMPESVTDRPTKAHEYVFLLSKSPRYFYDVDAIREPHVYGGERDSDGAWEQDAAGRPGPDGAQHLYGHPAGRNKRSVWTVATQPYAGAHFATFPPKLIEPCVLAGSAEGGVVLDPFAGSGTTGMVALRRQRSFIGIELNPEFVELARRRITDDAPLLNSVAET